MRPLLLPIAACLALGACGSVVMSTAAVLGMTSPLAADPAGFEIAITIPDGVDVPPNGAKFGVTNQNTVHDIDIANDYVLQRRETTDGLTLFRVNPADLEELREFQAKAKAWETENPSANSGSFSVGVEFCVIGDGPSETDLFDVSIRTEPDGPFMPLIRGAAVKDAIALIEDEGVQMDAVAKCP